MSTRVVTAGCYKNLHKQILVGYSKEIPGFFLHHYPHKNLNLFWRLTKILMQVCYCHKNLSPCFPFFWLESYPKLNIYQTTPSLTFVYDHLFQLSLGGSSLYYFLVNGSRSNHSVNQHRLLLSNPMSTVLSLKVILRILKK